MSNFSIIILAAGKGTRMKSDLPKVLHKVGEKSMLQRLVDTCSLTHPSKIVVVISHQAKLVEQSIEPAKIPVEFVLQSKMDGTADAAWTALPNITPDQKVVILYADSPLLTTNSLINLVNQQDIGGLSLFTCNVANPFGLGRLVIENGNATAIIEEKDATPEQRLITSVFPGGLCLDYSTLEQSKSAINNNNAQGEYYLTDLVSYVSQAKQKVTPVVIDQDEIASANDRLQLASLQKIYQTRLATKYMNDGLGIYDPTRTILTENLKFGKDCIIEANVTFQGQVSIGDRVIIKQGSIIKDSIIGSDTIIEPYSMIDQSKLGSKVSVGPFARLRPATVLSDKVKVGNFVEIKKSTLGHSSKASHLSYIGDANVGSQVNIGAGVITCNYDGYKKYQTEIGDGAFIGSDTQLVAPVKVGNNVTVAAGSTVTKDVESGLVMSRTKQSNLPNWINKSKP